MDFITIKSSVFWFKLFLCTFYVLFMCQLLIGGCKNGDKLNSLSYIYIYIYIHIFVVKLKKITRQDKEIAIYETSFSRIMYKSSLLLSFTYHSILPFIFL
jgi:hypothetical protein